MAKKKSLQDKQKAETHMQRKVRKRTRGGPIARTAVAAGLAIAVGGGLEGCSESEIHDKDATVQEAGGGGTTVAILPPADAAKDTGIIPIMAPLDAGRDVVMYAILPPIDAAADGAAPAILAPGDAATDSTVVAILPPRDAGKESGIYPIMIYPILPITPSDGGFYGII
jgi:hypothetical protein